MILVTVIESERKSGLVINEYDMFVEDSGQGLNCSMEGPIRAYCCDYSDVEVTIVERAYAVETIWDGGAEPPILLTPGLILAPGNDTGH